MKMILYGWMCPCGASQPKTMSHDAAADAAQAHDRETHDGERTALRVSTVSVTTA